MDETRKVKHIQFLNCDVCKEPTPSTQMTNTTRTVVLKSGTTITVNHKHCDDEFCKKEAETTLRSDVKTIMEVVDEL